MKKKKKFEELRNLVHLSNEDASKKLGGDDPPPTDGEIDAYGLTTRNKFIPTAVSTYYYTLYPVADTDDPNQDYVSTDHQWDG